MASEGALVLGEALRSNNRLKILNISGNRFKNDSAKMLAEGLIRNQGLYSLSMKDNPIGIDGVTSILNALTRNRFLGIRVLDLLGVPVNMKVLHMVETIRHRLQNDPKKALTKQQLAVQKQLTDKYGVDFPVANDFEFQHGEIFKDRKPIPVITVTRVYRKKSGRTKSSTNTSRTTTSLN